MEPQRPQPRLRRILTFGDVLDESVRVYRQHFVFFALVSAIALIPSGVVIALLSTSTMTTLLRTSTELQNGAAVDPNALLAQGFQLASLGVVSIVIATLFGLLYTSVIIVTADAYFNGKQPTIGGVFRTVLPRLLWVLVASVLLFVGLAVLVLIATLLAGLTLGGLFGLLPLIGLLFWWLRPSARRTWLKWFIILVTPYGLPMYFGFCWAMYLASIVLEHRGPADALSRSSALTAGVWFRVFGLLLVAPLIVGVLVYVINLIVGGMTGAFRATRGAAFGPDSTTAIFSVAISIFLQILFQSVAVIVYTLLFHDLRNRREGTDIAERLSQLESAPLPANG